MNSPTIRMVSLADDPVLEALRPLFESMHAEMAGQGMRLRLAPDGAALWVRSITGGLGRFGTLAVAERDGDLVGFAHAAIKLAPEHLGGGRTGHITHIHVIPEHRRSGIARQLAQALHHWLDGMQVESTELQVLHANQGGLAFWRSLGYAPELVQLRKP